jgi:hypothetical protein
MSGKISIFGCGIHAIYSLISLAALRIAILSTRMARQSADASIATVRAWLDIHTLKFVYSPAAARESVAPTFSLTVENLGRTPAKALSLTAEFVFGDQWADQQFTGCPATNLTRNPFMVAGPPGEPFSFPVESAVAAKFAQLNDSRRQTAMTNLERLTEFCVRYYGGDHYEIATIPT